MKYVMMRVKQVVIDTNAENVLTKRAWELLDSWLKMSSNKPHVGKAVMGSTEADCVEKLNADNQEIVPSYLRDVGVTLDHLCFYAEGMTVSDDESFWVDWSGIQKACNFRQLEKASSNG